MLDCVILLLAFVLMLVVSATRNNSVFLYCVYIICIEFLLLKQDDLVVFIDLYRWYSCMFDLVGF